ncbi:hypothetical protein NEISICOT_00041 [Neisseria sicca ATCC 29256]|uniref:Uncharacterized protein n=1 Tax=Neisseria sicca ATCC 29256 TaxID=547045 RepID=C6M0L6_NEISI|nr:hypothetical protein NEISICOT_00041 [Neisseria sicca ATCC 29256]
MLSVLSAASSPCPDLNLIHYYINLKMFRYVRNGGNSSTPLFISSQPGSR